MASLILPMAVDVPVPTTTALQRPEVTWVPYTHAHMHNTCTCTTRQISQKTQAHVQHVHNTCTTRQSSQQAQAHARHMETGHHSAATQALPPQKLPAAMSSSDERRSVRHAHRNPQEVHVRLQSAPPGRNTGVAAAGTLTQSVSHSLRTGC